MVTFLASTCLFCLSYICRNAGIASGIQSWGGTWLSAGQGTSGNTKNENLGNAISWNLDIIEVLAAVFVILQNLVAAVWVSLQIASVVCP